MAKARQPANVPRQSGEAIVIEIERAEGSALAHREGEARQVHMGEVEGDWRGRGEDGEELLRPREVGRGEIGLREKENVWQAIARGSDHDVFSLLSLTLTLSLSLSPPSSLSLFVILPPFLFLHFA